MHEICTCPNLVHSTGVCGYAFKSIMQLIDRTTNQDIVIKRLNNLLILNERIN